ACERSVVMPPAPNRSAFIRWFEEIGIDDVSLVGGKNASLGEMYRELAGQGVRVPNGFAVTAEAYRHFLVSTGLDKKIRAILEGLDTQNVDNLRMRGHEVRQAIMAGSLPERLVDEIGTAY